MVKIYRNAIIPNYDQLSNASLEKDLLYLPIKRVRFLLLKVLNGNPIGFEIHREPYEDAFWEVR
jgi:hypothetical protein